MALTGFLQNGTCFANIDSAYADYVSSLSVPVITPVSYVALNFCPTCAWGGLTSHYYYSYFDLVGVPLAPVFNHNFSIPSPVFPSCDPIQPFLDGSFLGFTVAGAVITVSLLAVLRRAL